MLGSKGIPGMPVLPVWRTQRSSSQARRARLRVAHVWGESMKEAVGGRSPSVFRADSDEGCGGIWSQVRLERLGRGWPWVGGAGVKTEENP